MKVHRSRLRAPLEKRRIYECAHCGKRGRTIEIPLKRYERLMKELEDMRIHHRTIVRIINRETPSKVTGDPSGAKGGHL